MQFHARLTIALANDRFAIGIVHAARDAGAVIADLLAKTFGIGGLGQHEPQRRSGHAKQDFAHCFASGSFMSAIAARRFGSPSCLVRRLNQRPERTSLGIPRRRKTQTTSMCGTAYPRPR